MNSKPIITLEIFTLMLLRGLGPGRPPPHSDYLVYIDIQWKKKLSHQMTAKILYLSLSFPTKTTFIFTESWKSYQLIRGQVVFLFSFDTYDVVRSWSIFLLPSIVFDNLFVLAWYHCRTLNYKVHSVCCISWNPVKASEQILSYSFLQTQWPLQGGIYINPKQAGGGASNGEHIKCLIFDSEMCTLQKVGGKDSKGRRVLWMSKTSLKHVI